MSTKIEDVVYYTEDELNEAKITAESTIADLEEQIAIESSEKAELDEKFTLVNKELEKLKGKEMNFHQLRDSKQRANEKAIETEEKLIETTKQLNTFLTETQTEILTDYKNEQGITADKELEEKFNHFFEKVQGKKAVTKSQIITAANEAYILASAQSDTDVVKFVVPRNASYQTKKQQEGKENNKEMMNDFGISDDDVTKYSGSPTLI